MIDDDNLPKNTRARISVFIDEINRLKQKGYTYNEIFIKIKAEIGLPQNMNGRTFSIAVQDVRKNIKSGAYVVEQRRLSTSAIQQHIATDVQIPAQKRTVAEMVQAAKDGKLVTEKSKQSNVVDLTT